MIRNLFEEDTGKMINKMKEIFKEKEKAYFTNADCYSHEKEFLLKLTKILSNNEITNYEFLSFENCIKFLVNKGYLVLDETYAEKMDFTTYLIKAIKDLFKIDIDEMEFDKKYEYYSKQITSDKKLKNKTIKFLLTEECIAELLKEKGYGLVYLYSAGDFYSYGVVTLDKIKQLEKLFEF